MLKRIISSIIIFIPALILVAYFHEIVTDKLWNMANDPGLGWHIKTGELIVNTLQIPRNDPFLLNGELFPWVANQWLADVLLYVLYYYGGWTFLHGLVALGIPLALWGLLYTDVLKRSRSILFITTCMIPVLTLHYVHFVIRPVFFQLIFFILLTIWLYKLNASCRSKSEYSSYICPALILLMLVWANVHPSFAVGLGLILLLYACLLAEKMDGSNNLNARQILLLTLTACLTVLASGLNPYFFKLHHFILFYMSGDNIRIQQEWDQLHFSSEYFPVFILLVLVFMTVLFLCRKNLQSLGLFPIVSVFPFMLLSLMAVRYLPFFGVVVLSAIAYMLQYLPDDLKRLVINSQQDVNRAGKLASITLALGLVAVVYNLGFKQTEGALGPAREHYPFESVAWLNSKHTDNSVYYGILNSMNWGGFITFYGESLKATVDDRLFFFSSDYVASYLKLMREPSPAALRKILTVQHDYILVIPDSPFGLWLKKNFSGQILLETENEILLDAPGVMQVNSQLS